MNTSYSNSNNTRSGDTYASMDNSVPLTGNTMQHLMKLLVEHEISRVQNELWMQKIGARIDEMSLAFGKRLDSICIYIEYYIYIYIYI